MLITPDAGKNDEVLLPTLEGVYTCDLKNPGMLPIVQK